MKSCIIGCQDTNGCTTKLKPGPTEKEILFITLTDIVQGKKQLTLMGLRRPTPFEKKITPRAHFFGYGKDVTPPKIQKNIDYPPM